MKKSGNFTFCLGDVYFFEDEEEYCCIVNPNDVDWLDSSTQRLLSSQAQALLFLDEGYPQFVMLRTDSVGQLVGPKTQEEIEMWRMLNPRVDFSYWRELYGKN